MDLPLNQLHAQRTALELYWCQGYERGGSSLEAAAFGSWAKSPRTGSPDELTVASRVGVR